MKKILIISPHFPPSNLAGVHRSRLFAQHLPSFGWEPVILTVHEKYYEEQLDRNLEKLIPSQLRIEKTKALKITKPRIIGDVGLRAFIQLYKRAKKIIQSEKIDFLYIPIPSFYVAILGRLLHRSTGIKYGIDYIDPWVHHFPGTEKKLSRHWWSTKISKFLEPIAIKNASLITGVAEGYYKGVLERNPELKSSCKFGAMPYGGEVMDHMQVQKMTNDPYLFNVNKEKIKIVYAGAMLPKAYGPLEKIFQSINQNVSHFGDVEFHFIGTGKTPNDSLGFNLKPLAEKYGLWNSIIFEYPKRIPYLDVLIHLEAADAVFILGSTEPHYTPSKVYQGVLAQKPILAVLHEQSTAVKVIRESGAGQVLSFNGDQDLEKIKLDFHNTLIQFLSFIKTFKPEEVNQEKFNQYSAKAVTQQLSGLLNSVNDEK